MDGIEGQPILQISLIRKFPTVVQRQTTFPPFMHVFWTPVDLEVTCSWEKKDA